MSRLESVWGVLHRAGRTCRAGAAEVTKWITPPAPVGSPVWSRESFPVAELVQRRASAGQLGPALMSAGVLLEHSLTCLFLERQDFIYVEGGDKGRSRKRCFLHWFIPQVAWPDRSQELGTPPRSPTEPSMWAACCHLGCISREPRQERSSRGSDVGAALPVEA